MRPRARIVLAVLLVALGGCAFLDDQVHVASSTGCISNRCGHEVDAPGYQRCEAACRSSYGR